MSRLGEKITKNAQKNIHTEAGMSLIKRGLPKSVETEAVMSFRISAQRRFYAKAVMLLIQQALISFCHPWDDECSARRAPCQQLPADSPPHLREGVSGLCSHRYEVHASADDSEISPTTGRASDGMQTFKLRGLDPARSYLVSVDGTGTGETIGQTLSTSGMAIRLDSEWRAAVVELQAQ